MGLGGHRVVGLDGREDLVLEVGEGAQEHVDPCGGGIAALQLDVWGGDLDVVGVGVADRVAVVGVDRLQVAG